MINADMTTIGNTIRLAVVEDHASIRELLVEAFSALAETEIVGEAATGKDAIELCERTQPDVLLLDAMLPDLSGLECLQAIRRVAPQVKVLIFSGNTNAMVVNRALQQGVHGYVEKSASFSEVVTAVQLVARGGAYFGKAIKPTLYGIRTSPFPLGAASKLSNRECSVLAALALGKSSKEIAADLGLSTFTVQNHRRRIKAKTGLRTTSDLTLHALNLGLVEDPAAQPRDISQIEQNG